VAFLRRARVTEPLPEQYFEGAPDLAVEVLSPDDRWTEVEAKVDEYLAAGTVRVWVVDARRREVHVFGAGGRSRLGGEQVLEGEELLPGFRLPLSELFR
jgi:Uma2 family endonuclease